MTEPGYCPREKGMNEVCEPWVYTIADDGTSFICCGESDSDSRSVPQDKFRLCFVNADTDTCYDHDVNDLLDLLAMISGALALEKRTEMIDERKKGHE